MIFKFRSRLLLQKPGSKAIYSIPVVSASTHAELPFFVPTMDIEVLSQKWGTDFIAPVRFDDIVRLQVSVQFNDYEKVKWQDLFSGRILTPSVQFQNGKNTARFSCVGNSDETRTKLIENAYNLTTDATIENIFIVNMALNADRISYDPALDVENLLPQNLDITDYQIKAGQKYIKDFLQDLEKLTAYSWYFKERARYNADGTLIVPTVIDFLPLKGTPPLPSTGIAYKNQFGDTWNVTVSGGTVTSISVNGTSTGQTSGKFTLNNNDTITLAYSEDNAPYWDWIPVNCPTTYKIIEGTSRFLSADFQAIGDMVYTRAIETGAQITGGSTNYLGWSENITASGLYGKRVFSETNTGFTSNAMCARFAKGIVDMFRYPIPAGQVVLQLTPEAKIGDFVPVTIPSVDLNGSIVNNYFRVMKVQHDISATRATTTLDLGYVVSTPEDFLLRFAKQAQLAMKNFIS